MSDGKPRRAPRDSGRGEPAKREAAPEPASGTVTAKTEPPVPAAAPEPAAQPGPEPASANDPWAVFSEAQAVLARAFEQIAVEMVGATRSSLAATADAAVALVGARTFAEAVEINAGLARRSIDGLIETSARLSEIAIKAPSEASRPILSRFAGMAGLDTGHPGRS